MILSSKQLEELENLHDGVDEFDEEANTNNNRDDFTEAVEGALAWRRGMLEKAINNVKNINKTSLSSKNKLSVGNLVFDPLNLRYARVKSIKKDEVLLTYIAGGEAVLQGMAIQSVGKPSESLSPAKKAASKKTTKKPTAKKKIELKKKADPKKTTKKPAAKKKIEPKKKADPKKTIKKPAKKAAKKSSNPDSLIKKSYKKMSNKEIAALTGLSEHTIRRKLGEWGLKRKKQ